MATTNRFRRFTDDPDEVAAPLGEGEESFADLFEKSAFSMKEGDVIRGRVIDVTKDHVLVDIGYKSEGLIPMAEFAESGMAGLKPGDDIDVLLESQENEEGNIILSKEKADKMKVWDVIQRAYEADATVDGKIVARVKGGLSVDVGVRAFLPGSQVDLRPVRNLEKMIGETFQFKVLKFNKKRGNIVLSRRALLEKDREVLRTKTLEKLKEGAIIDGIVKNITEYGAFIDLGGIDGLLHITDMGWGRINHPSELFEIGDEVRVKVLKYDEERKRVSLGLKQVSPDPWTQAGGKYEIGQRIQGKVISLTDYGAFVEIEEGIEGLIHISEMSWTRKIKHPSKILAVGDVIEAVVLDINPEARRISLGLKQTEPNPWDVVADRYPIGTKIAGKIRNITDFGIFVGIDEGIDGLIHISDISWTQRIKHPSELFKKGQEIEAIVLNIDKEAERFSLGIKQLTADPWERVPTKYRSGDIVSGEVINVTDFGIFVLLEEGIEGLIHVSELSSRKVDDPSTICKVGDRVSAEIISVDLRERRIRLSMRALEVNEEKADLAEFMNRQGDATVKMGDLLQRVRSTDNSSENQ
jgi:small subunit ribosomal protein S1